MAAVRILVALFVVTVVAGGTHAGAPVVHHVVDGDRAPDNATDVGPWSSGRIFRIGDTLWFRYFSPQETIVELGSIEEYHACDLTNPIKMYTDDVNQVPLEKEGIRYFASASYEKCKNGFKLPVHVHPPEPLGPPERVPPVPKPFGPPEPVPPAPKPDPPAPIPPAPVPPAPKPSSATHLNGLQAQIFIGLFVYGLYSL